MSKSRRDRNETPGSIITSFERIVRPDLRSLSWMQTFVFFDLGDLATLEVKRGAQLAGEVVRYQDSYLLCYIRGPEGLLIGLAQELN